MSLPGDLTTITVTGKYLDGAGNPQSGAVTFTPSNELSDLSGKTVLAQVPIVSALGTLGTFSQPGLACTDNANLRPSGWWWVIGVAVPGAQQTFSVFLPSSFGATVDITAVSPEVSLPTAQVSGPTSAPIVFAQQAGGLSVPFVSSVNGQSGVVTVANAGLLGLANTWTAANTFSQSIVVPEGSNAWMGTAVLNGVTPVTVSTSAVSAKSRVFLTTQAPGGTPGAAYVGTVTPGVSFTVLSTSSSDSSTVAWHIINHT